MTLTADRRSLSPTAYTLLAANLSLARACRVGFAIPDGMVTDVQLMCQHVSSYVSLGCTTILINVHASGHRNVHACNCV